MAQILVKDDFQEDLFRAIFRIGKYEYTEIFSKKVENFVLSPFL
jgi:hypothetical protein